MLSTSTPASWPMILKFMIVSQEALSAPSCALYGAPPRSRKFTAPDYSPNDERVLNGFSADEAPDQ
jgi:hypothetical protein